MIDMMLRTKARVGVLIAAMLLTGSAAAAGQVIVGSTNFTEQLILANIYTDVLEARGVDVQQRLNLGSREVVFPALESGELDILPEYTGAALQYLREEDSRIHKPAAVSAALRKALPDDLVMLEPASAQDKDALVVTQATAAQYDLESFSDLAPVASKLVLGGPPELKTRYVGLPGFKEVYGMEFKSFRSLDAGGPLTTGALDNGDIDVALMFTTQGIISQRGWVVLEDDKNMIAAQNLVPLVRKDALNDTIRSALNEISTQLTTQGLQDMNSRVSVDKKSPASVAAQWVQKHDLGG